MKETPRSQSGDEKLHCDTRIYLNPNPGGAVGDFINLFQNMVPGHRKSNLTSVYTLQAITKLETWFHLTFPLIY
jgi:hypothetical protein